MSSLPSVTASPAAAPSSIAPWLEEIIDKKVNDVALSCFEVIVHWVLTTFSCFYPSYQNFYEYAAPRVAIAAQEVLHTTPTLAQIVTPIDKAVNQNVGFRARHIRSIDDLHLNGRKAKFSTLEP